jgi:hypothetical protein
MTEMERRGDAVVVPVYAGGTWDELVAQSEQIFGADLEKGASLLGVPFVIVRATFRPGNYIRSDMKGVNGDVVFISVITGPQTEIDKGKRRGRIADDCPVEPGEHLGFNEAGTGVYRQVVLYLETAGLIRLPEPEKPEEGRYGESRLDAPVKTWLIHDSATTAQTDTGDVTVNFDLRLFCPRGLRESSYENEHTKQGVTRYIA